MGRDTGLNSIKINLSSFKGTSDPSLYLDWELQCNCIFQLNELTSQKKAAHAITQFEFYASTWRETKRLQRARIDNLDLPDWDELKVLMMERYITKRYARLEGTNSSTPKPKGIICFKCQGWGHKASEFLNKRNIVLVEGDPYFVGDKVTKNDVSEGTPQEYDGDDGEPERVVEEGEFNVPCGLMRRTPHADAWPEEDSWQSGSISFGRFENEALCWERRSSFTHNRYLEEVEKYFKPGSVTEKKAYFEEIFRRRALLSQSSFDCQDGTDSQASNVGSENTDYEGHFEHVNEIDHSTCFVENHDRAATLLENGKYQASENEGYAGRFEHVNEVVHSARFDENYDSSTHLSKNGKYQAENTGYDGDSERVNEVGDSARFEESFDGSNNRDIEVTECGGEGSINGDIEVTECGGEDSISCHSGPQTRYQ
ncbi:hypothetical protein T459_35060 [Capsicum annuum]|uniref:Uncharacterized protein n=1 Tax=Capsicum annuum TaxID=4072 RepID=A0A2G2XUC0_CAPAN|nr:hypothetical protein T459_35060 [Capsicum annuum]